MPEQLSGKREVELEDAIHAALAAGMTREKIRLEVEEAFASEEREASPGDE